MSKAVYFVQFGDEMMVADIEAANVTNLYKSCNIRGNFVIANLDGIMKINNEKIKVKKGDLIFTAYNMSPVIVKDSKLRDIIYEEILRRDNERNQKCDCNNCICEAKPLN